MSFLLNVNILISTLCLLCIQPARSISCYTGSRATERGIQLGILHNCTQCQIQYYMKNIFEWPDGYTSFGSSCLTHNDKYPEFIDNDIREGRPTGQIITYTCGQDYCNNVMKMAEKLVDTSKTIIQRERYRTISFTVSDAEFTCIVSTNSTDCNSCPQCKLWSSALGFAAVFFLSGAIGLAGMLVIRQCTKRMEKRTLDEFVLIEVRRLRNKEAAASVSAGALSASRMGTVSSEPTALWSITKEKTKLQTDVTAPTLQASTIENEKEDQKQQRKSAATAPNLVDKDNNNEYIFCSMQAPQPGDASKKTKSAASNQKEATIPRKKKTKP